MPAFNPDKVEPILLKSNLIARRIFVPVTNIL
jgi:hypothetical protein